MTLATVRRGREAEEAAADFLQGKGWKILQKNFRTRSAELDLVGLDKETLVFVEVKQRSTVDLGHPEEAVDSRKIAKLYQAASFFLKRNPQHARRDCRFDVIAVEGAGQERQLRHLADVACL